MPTIGTGYNADILYKSMPRMLQKTDIKNVSISDIIYLSTKTRQQKPFIKVKKERLI